MNNNLPVLPLYQLTQKDWWSSRPSTKWFTSLSSRGLYMCMGGELSSFDFLIDDVLFAY